MCLKQSYRDLRTLNDFDGKHLVRFMDVCGLGRGPIDANRETPRSAWKHLQANHMVKHGEQNPDLKDRYQPECVLHMVYIGSK